jgi:RNA polymerase sigma factor (sigma-70 family)
MNIERLIIDHLPLAEKLASQENMKVFCGLDEIRSAAYMGLVDAARKFDPSRNVPFGAYARTRIVGEIKDHLRFLMKKASCRETVDDFEAPESRDAFCTEDFFVFVDEVLGSFHGKIMRMYYIENRTLMEIGVSMGVSESRISQIIKKCHRRLKCAMA